MPLTDFFIYLDTAHEERVRVRLTIEKGKLTDLVYQYESLIDGQWHPIVRYDMAHGFFHRDVLFPNGTQQKTRIDLPTLEIAALFADQDLKDKWEFYKEGYISKFK